MRSPLTIQYLGQEGFLLTDGARTAVIDPYLSYSVDRLDGFPAGFWTRNYPPPVEPAELTDVDLVLCSHDHLDHADPETLRGIAKASPHAQFAGPHATVALMHEIGLAPTRVVELNAGQTFAWKGVQIEAIAAAHESYELDLQGRHRFVGFLLRWNELTLYHAGDTLATPELSTRLEGERIDLGFLPVNGADDTRRKLDIAGNMNVADAVALAARHNFRLLVPMHYDLYACNGLSSEEFSKAWKAQPAVGRVPLKIFQPGETFVVPAPLG